MSEKLTSFGPMGPGGVARALAEPLRQVRRAIEAIAGEKYSDVRINSEIPTGKAVESLAATLRPFAEGTPPGFYDFEARSQALYLRHAKDDIALASKSPDAATALDLLWGAFRALTEQRVRLDAIEHEALRRRNANARAEGADPS